MSCFIRYAGLILLSAIACLQPAFSATIIEYEVIDLGIMPSSQHLWEYRYFVSGITFAANQGYTIWFDWNHTGQLNPPSPPNGQWSVIVLQPDLNLPDNGAFDALALVDGASTGQPFVVDFIWSGNTPERQFFDIDQFDSSGNLTAVIDRGVTVPKVPEPGTFWLVAGAAAGLGLARRRAVARRQRR